MGYRSRGILCFPGWRFVIVVVTRPVGRFEAVAHRERGMVTGYTETKVLERKLVRSLSGCSPARFVPNTGCFRNAEDPGRGRERLCNCSRT